MKKLVVGAGIAAVMAVALCGCGSSVGGTYYHINNDGETEVLNINKDRTGDDGKYTFDWTQEGDDLSVQWQSFGVTYHVKVVSSDELTYTDEKTGEVEVYYKEQEKAQGDYDARVAEWEVARDAKVDAARDLVVGTWMWTNEGGDKASTVVVNDDGTWTQEGYFNDLYGKKVTYTAYGVVSVEGEDNSTLSDLNAIGAKVMLKIDGNTVYEKGSSWQNSQTPQPRPIFTLEYDDNGTPEIAGSSVEGGLSFGFREFSKVL